MVDGRTSSTPRDTAVARQTLTGCLVGAPSVLALLGDFPHLFVRYEFSPQLQYPNIK